LGNEIYEAENGVHRFPPGSQFRAIMMMRLKSETGCRLVIVQVYSGEGQ